MVFFGYNSGIIACVNLEGNTLFKEKPAEFSVQYLRISDIYINSSDNNYDDNDCSVVYD